MTNKEKAFWILDRIKIKENALNNAIAWYYPASEIKDIQMEINKLQDELVAMIPD